MLAGLASLIGGALSMCVGEFISVSSQRDAEAADVQREREEQAKGSVGHPKSTVADCGDHSAACLKLAFGTAEWCRVVYAWRPSVLQSR